jgi:hypothetical protein
VVSWFSGTDWQFETGSDLAADAAFAGSAAASGSDEILLSVGTSYRGTVTWSPNTGFGSPVAVDGASHEVSYGPLALGAAGEIGVFGADGLWWSADDGVTYRNDPVLPTQLAHYDFLLAGSSPRIGYTLDGILELVRPDADGYWAYAAVDTGVADASVSLALDSDGVLHACYQKSGVTRFY